jgi:hypothetical protein
MYLGLADKALDDPDVFGSVKLPPVLPLGHPMPYRLVLDTLAVAQ